MASSNDLYKNLKQGFPADQFQALTLQPTSVAPTPESHLLAVIAASGLELVSWSLDAHWSDHELVVFRSVAEQAYKLLYPLRATLRGCWGELGREIWKNISNYVQNNLIPFPQVATYICDCAHIFLGIPSLCDAFFDPCHLIQQYGPTLGALGSNTSVMRAMLIAALVILERVDAVPRLRQKTLYEVKVSVQQEPQKPASLTGGDLMSDDSMDEAAVEVELGLGRRENARSGDAAVIKRSTVNQDTAEAAQKPRRPHTSVAQHAATASKSAAVLGESSALTLLPFIVHHFLGSAYELDNCVKAFKHIALTVDEGLGDPEVEKTQYERILRLFSSPELCRQWNALRCQREARYRR